MSSSRRAAGGLQGTHGLDIGPDGNLYVCNRYHDSILRYDGATGAFLDEFVPAGPSSGGLSIPIGLVFGPDGCLYVSSYGTNSRSEERRVGKEGRSRWS